MPYLCIVKIKTDKMLNNVLSNMILVVVLLIMRS